MRMAIISIFRHDESMAEIQQYKKEQAAAQLQGSLKGKADEISILHYQFAGVESRRIIAKLDNGTTYDFALRREFESSEKLLKFLGAQTKGAREENVGNDFFKPSEKKNGLPAKHEAPVYIAPARQPPGAQIRKAATRSSPKITGNEIYHMGKSAKIGFLGDSLMVGTYGKMPQENTQDYFAAAKVGQPISYARGKLEEFNRQNGNSLEGCVLQAGINDLAGGASKENVLKSYIGLIEVAKKACKNGGVVYAVGLLPYQSRQEDVDYINKKLREYSNTQESDRGIIVEFLDPKDYLPAGWNNKIIHQTKQDAYYSGLAEKIAKLIG